VQDTSLLGPVAVVAWLKGMDLLMPEGWTANSAVARVPVRLYVPAAAPEMFANFPAQVLTPPLEIPALTFSQRRAIYRAGLPDELSTAIDECSRRYRLPELVIERIVRTVLAKPGGPDADGLMEACRTESENTMGSLAQRVVPRFAPGELVLPDKQQQQFEEILRAMQTLTEVHYQWGTAKAWNESGLTVLFAGPPGTGKTMGAEILAAGLDLPMYRIDLSQVVNKYIGETEKNLKRIFDAAERSDCILFFDEADALFGKRTEVKDAHDRFANIEISYLLERMERFKGLAILATNRKKDLDEAFLRRLRFVIEFPLPGVRERERIWRQVFPENVNVSRVDFNFLARQFSLTGGHIRSIAFAACLQSAAAAREAGTGERSVSMKTLLLAVKRELEKMNRASGDGVFGVHGETMRGLAG
jgi:DNA polymerase III delta prime subunit